LPKPAKSRFGLHCPLGVKHGFIEQYDNHSIKNIGKQLDEKPLKNIKLDAKMTVLKLLLCSWLYLAWQYVNWL
jgi:hypothetical protein